MKLDQTKNGTIVEIFVKPKSPQFRISVEGEEIVVRCTEEPVKGKVNREIIKEFSKLFHAQIEIVSGQTSKEKRLLISGIDKNVVEKTLSKC